MLFCLHQTLQHSNTLSIICSSNCASAMYDIQFVKSKDKFPDGIIISLWRSQQNDPATVCLISKLKTFDFDGTPCSILATKFTLNIEERYIEFQHFKLSNGAHCISLRRKCVVTSIKLRFWGFLQKLNVLGFLGLPAIFQKWSNQLKRCHNSNLRLKYFSPFFSIILYLSANVDFKNKSK